jgi:hypothetical protein
LTDDFLVPVAKTTQLLCSFEGPLEGSHRSPVAMARGKHLFPFRTEKLSPSAPMVLGPQGPGRVGRRRFFRRWAARRAAHRACCAATLPRRDAASPRTVRFSLAYLTWSRAAHASAGGRARSQRRRAEQRPPGHGPPAARARPRERAAVRVDTGPGGEAWRRRRVSGRPGAYSARGRGASSPRGLPALWEAGAGASSSSTNAFASARTWPRRRLQRLRSAANTCS